MDLAKARRNTEPLLWDIDVWPCSQPHYTTVDCKTSSAFNRAKMREKFSICDESMKFTLIFC